MHGNINKEDLLVLSSHSFYRVDMKICCFRADEGLETIQRVSCQSLYLLDNKMSFFI